MIVQFWKYLTAQTVWSFIKCAHDCTILEVHSSFYVQGAYLNVVVRQDFLLKLAHVVMYTPQSVDNVENLVSNLFDIQSTCKQQLV